MQQQTRVSIWCDYGIEAGWLLILTLIPIYFNLFSARHFEPDKATTLRSLVSLMLCFAFIRALEHIRVRAEQRYRMGGASPLSPPAEERKSLRQMLKQWEERLNNIPLAIPVVLYVFVFLLTTITSVVPHTSFWGSYQRLQGTYTNLSYVALFVLIVLRLRSREQLERMISISLVAGLVVALYGFAQHLGLDPLPWKGDVETRVASTMGNAIFVSAYLIMVVPLALYRLVRHIGGVLQPAGPNGPAKSPHPVQSQGTLVSIGWASTWVFLTTGTILLLVAAIKFGVEAGGLLGSQYWWVFPGAIVIATGLWNIPTLQIPYRVNRPVPLVPLLLPLVLLVVYVVMLSRPILLSVAPPMEVARQLEAMTKGPPWWQWLFGGILLIGTSYALIFWLPSREVFPSRITHTLHALGVFIILVCLITTIVFSGSRGPWLGLFAGLFTFFTLLLWLAGRRSRTSTIGLLRNGLRVAFWAWIALALAVGFFLVIFNVSDAPFFEQLRKHRYLGRLGQITDVTSGTGLVRRLIWFGDEHGGGTVALITARPFRTIVGWGPESMFVAFNPYYPPSLANIEQRTASPDRAHQAILDELVTRGLLGLVSYFFVLLSFAVLALRVMFYSKEWLWQVFAIATLSTVISHVIEGMVGIPIVATLTMLWMVMGMTVVGGMLAGHYTLGSSEVFRWRHLDQKEEERPSEQNQADQHHESKLPEPIAGTPPHTPSETPPHTPSPTADDRSRPPSTAAGDRSQKTRVTTRSTNPASMGKPGGRAGRSQATRGAHESASREKHKKPSYSQRVGMGAKPAWPTFPVLGMYAVLFAIALWWCWWGNIRFVYADVRFHEGEAAVAQIGPRTSTEDQMHAQIAGLSRFLDAIHHNVAEDFYYLSLGRSLMEIAELKRASGAPIGELRGTTDINDLLALRQPIQVRDFVHQRSPIEMISYAESALKRALELSPLNKDHYANLARLNNFWYNWTSDIERLEYAAAWYEKVNTEIAPNDVALINEHAGIRLAMASILSKDGKAAQAQEHLDRAKQLYERSIMLDPNYGKADLHLGNIFWQEGNVSQAISYYARSVRRAPESLNDQLSDILPLAEYYPEQLRFLRDAYLDGARKSAQAKRKKYEQVASAYATAGLLSIQMNDFAGATEAYSQAIRLNPNALEYYQNYTIALSDTHQYAAALEAARSALALARKQGKSDEVVRWEQLVNTLDQKSKEAITP